MRESEFFNSQDTDLFDFVTQPLAAQCAEALPPTPHCLNPNCVPASPLNLCTPDPEADDEVVEVVCNPAGTLVEVL